MANALPWSVRGIDPDIREQAVEAAHRSGMSVGQWLNQVLAGSLDEDEIEDPYPARSRHAAARKAPRRFEALGDRLERLAHGRGETAIDRTMPAMPDNSRLLDLIESAAQAIERLEKRQARQDEGRGSHANEQVLIDSLRVFERKLDGLAQARALHPPAAEMPAPAPLRPAGLHGDADPAFTRTLAEIEARRRSLDGGDAGPAMPRTAPTGGPGLETMSQQLASLVSRIDEMRAEKRPDESGLQARLDDLANRIAEWRETPSHAVTTLRSELAALSTAVAELHPARIAAALEDALARTTERAIRAQHGDGDRVLESIGRLNEDVRAALRDLNDNRSVDRLGQELGNLSKRLDLVTNAVGGTRLDDIARDTQALRASIEQTARNNPADLLTRRLDELARKIDQKDDRGVLEAVHALGDQVKTLAGSGIKGLESKLTDMTREMKKLAADQQPLPQMSAIAERLERIDRLLDHRPDSTLGGLDAIVQSLDKISARLDREPAAGESETPALLAELATRMDRLAAQPQDSQSLERLQDEIGRLFQKIEALGQAPAGLDTLERGVSELFAQFDQTRKDMRNLAEAAAHQAAEQAIRNAPRDDSNDTLAAEGLLLIKRDLNEFKTAQSEAERRTRSTLEALHGTLEGIVAKLGDLEARKAEPRMPAEGRPVAPARPDMPAGAATNHPAAPMPPGRREPAPPAAEAPARAEVPQPVAAPRDLEAKALVDSDLPLEPGMQPGSAGAAPSATSDLRTQYLAAARRAAQAAAESSQAVLAEHPKAGKAGRKKLLVGAEGGSLLSRARKPLLLGLAALIFSLGALKVMTGRFGKSEDLALPPIPQKPAVSAPVTPGSAQGPGAPIEQDSRTGKDDPQNTGSVPPRVPAMDAQQAIPTIQPNGMMSLPGGKRGQKLSETSAVSQTDPTVVGSVGGDGARPAETGRAAIAELVNVSNLKGQDKLRDAALAGNMAAWFEIGARYADGRGVPRDGKLAARWFEQAALAGHGPSQYRLGSLYREGKVVTKEPALAFQWFDRAAAQGHVLAMHNAAVLLAEGVHGAPDYAGAALWFKRAAEHGIKDSQFNVAILFARGLGVNQDLQESYRWFAIAALQGDQDAAKKRDDIAARLTKDQIAKENDRVKAFKPMSPNPATNEPGNWEKSGAQRS